MGGNEITSRPWRKIRAVRVLTTREPGSKHVFLLLMTLMLVGSCLIMARPLRQDFMDPRVVIAMSDDN